MSPDPAMAAVWGPEVTSVSVPANGTYGLDQNLDFVVNFNTATYVETIDGTPQISLTVGSITRYARYISGSGTTSLVFLYTVPQGDYDEDGITIGALDTNDGRLLDGSGYPAILTLNSVASTSGVLVDAIDAPAPVPTLTEWAMILMALALAGFAAFSLHNRRRQMAL